MIKDDSIFRHLPSGVKEEQLLFFDAMRHAAEIADLSYQRLRGTLTRIALAEVSVDSPILPTREISTAYLDAWAFVDAVDRFRALWKFAPGADHSATPVQESFFEKTRDIRAVRNFPDHLHKLMHVVDKGKGSALGQLSWFTVPDPEYGYACTLVPGHVRNVEHKVHLPLGEELELPTDHIHLRIATLDANLSRAYRLLAECVARLDKSLSTAFEQQGLLESRTGTDVLIKLTLRWDKPTDEGQAASPP